MGEDNDVPRTQSGRRSADNCISGELDAKGPKGALFGASGKGLLEGDVRRDYVLADGHGPDLGRALGDSFLTLMDEVVLLGLKDQQVFLLDSL